MPKRFSRDNLLFAFLSQLFTFVVNLQHRGFGLYPETSSEDPDLRQDGNGIFVLLNFDVKLRDVKLRRLTFHQSIFLAVTDMAHLFYGLQFLAYPAYQQAAEQKWQ